MPLIKYNPPITRQYVLALMPRTSTFDEVKRMQTRLIMRRFRASKEKDQLPIQFSQTVNKTER